MEDSKARFKALRETLGMTQAQAAEEFGVQPRAVRRWESLTAPQLPPAGVVDEMETMVDERTRVIVDTLALVERIFDSVSDEHGSDEVPDISLPYWSSQDSYCKCHDGDMDYRSANSISRGVADALRIRGRSVCWLLDPVDEAR